MAKVCARRMRVVLSLGTTGKARERCVYPMPAPPRPLHWPCSEGSKSRISLCATPARLAQKANEKSGPLRQRERAHNAHAQRIQRI